MSLTVMAEIVEELHRDVVTMCKAYYGNDYAFGKLTTSGRAFRVAEELGKHDFVLCLDVPQFEPNELNVKIVNNSLVVEGKHEEREDGHGYVERYFKRICMLPEGCDRDKLRSLLAPDGTLLIAAPQPDVGAEKSDKAGGELKIVLDNPEMEKTPSTDA